MVVCVLLSDVGWCVRCLLIMLIVYGLKFDLVCMSVVSVVGLMFGV